MPDKIASLFAALIVGCLLVGLVGLILPVILFLVGFGLMIAALAAIGWVLGRILS